MGLFSKECKGSSTKANQSMWYTTLTRMKGYNYTIILIVEEKALDKIQHWFYDKSMNKVWYLQ